MKPRPAIPLFFGAAIAAFVALALIHIGFGELNQDEGWYLYAARQVAEGLQPYADFAFTQGPLLPRVYAPFQPLLRWGGVGAGRALTALFGLLAVALSARLAARWAPPNAAPWAASAAALLIGVNVYQAYFFTVVKTYALCAVFLTAGFLALHRARRSNGAVWAFAGGALLAAAAAVRLSAGAAALAAAVWWFARGRRENAAAPWMFALGGALGTAAFFGPAWFFAREGLLFGLFEYHAGREPGAPLTRWIHRAGFLSRQAMAYWPAIAAALGWMAARSFRPAARQEAPAAAEPALWAVVAMTLTHLAAPFPYDDYQTIVYPLAAAALAAALAREVADSTAGAEFPAEARPARIALASLAAVCLISAGASPINQQWAIVRRDRIWWRSKTQPDLVRLRETAAWLRERVPEDQPLLTQDLYLAVEANRRVPRGFEMGPFAYYPDWPRDRAERLRVLNRELLLEALERAEAPWAAFSGYGLSIACPTIAELPAAERTRLRAALERRYEPVREIADFGQAHTTLTIYRRKD